MIEILLLLGIVASPQSSPSGAAEEPLEAEILDLERLWNEAHVAGDADTLDRLCADDLAVTVPAMTSMTKEESIGVLRAGRMKFLRYDTSDVTIRGHGGTAVVTGRLRRSRSIGDRSIEDDWRFTKVYAKRSGRWVVVAFHASLSPRG